MRTTRDEIKAYIKHFREKVERVRGYVFHAEDNLLKKNLLVTIIDAISRVTSNPGTGNRERFTGIVSNFGGWADQSRVSAPHVEYLLRKLNSPDYENARSYIKEIIGKNSDGRLVRLSDDPELEDCRKVWPVPVQERVLGQLSLLSFSHLNLLYAHRNSLVHEFRDPGHGMEFSNDNSSPYYHGRTLFDGSDEIGQRSLELVYPMDFYFKLAETIIKNVEQYLIRNEINPYGSYQFGSSWHGELN